MPFIDDSISLAHTQRALSLHFLAHPIFAVTRDGSGNLLALRERGEAPEDRKQPADKKLRLESFQHVEVDRIVDPAPPQAPPAQIERTMRDAPGPGADCRAMR